MTSDEKAVAFAATWAASVYTTFRDRSDALDVDKRLQFFSGFADAAAHEMIPDLLEMVVALDKSLAEATARIAELEAEHQD